jgi:hypothetical protein
MSLTQKTQNKLEWSMNKIQSKSFFKQLVFYDLNFIHNIFIKVMQMKDKVWTKHKFTQKESTISLKIHIQKQYKYPNQKPYSSILNTYH